MKEKFLDAKILEQQTELINLMNRLVVNEGNHSTAIDALSLIRINKPYNPVQCLQCPSVCITIQGAKKVFLIEKIFEYKAFQYMAYSVDLPITVQVTGATIERPYLSLKIALDMNELCDVLLETGDEVLGHLESSCRPCGLIVSDCKPALLDAAIRLVHLLENPKDIPILSKLIIREIYYRLLEDEQGTILKQIALKGSESHRISKVIEHIKKNFNKPLSLEALTRTAKMSSTALHQHFKIVTSMSPLQYQKSLRLQEARRLLMTEIIDAASVGFEVGYESPSQFNREYARMFGAPPKADIKRIKSLSEDESYPGEAL